MGPFRKFLLVGVGVIALHGLQACATETELNPQPLPPEGSGEGQDPEAAKDDRNSDLGSGGTASPAPSGADGGADGGDASDTGAE